MTSAEANLKFIETVQQMELYGMEIIHAKVRNNTLKEIVSFYVFY